MTRNSSNILASHKLRITVSRKAIIDTLLENKSALSEVDFEKILKETCDRTTIYRTLKSFLEKGVVHKVLDENSIVKYALCKDDCTEIAHNHEHVHFKCHQCGLTLCLDDIPIQTITLPKGYQKTEASFLIQGTCEKCNN